MGDAMCNFTPWCAMQHNPIGDWGGLPKPALKRIIAYLEGTKCRQTLGSFRLVNQFWSRMLDSHLKWLQPKRRYPFECDIFIQAFTNLHSLELLVVKVCPFMLCTAFSQLENMRTVILWMNGIGPQDMEVICSGLQMCHNLVNVNIQDNPITDKGCEHLAKALVGKTKLRTLTLWSAGVGDLGLCWLTNILQDGSGLRLMDLRGNSVTEIGARALASCLRQEIALTRIVLAGNKIGPMGMREFAMALKRPTHLRLLDLAGCDVSDDAVVEFSEALMGNHQLLALVLTWNELTNASAFALARVVSKGIKLRCLDVRDNRIKDKGVRELIESARVSSSLKKLGVQFNPMSKDFLEKAQQEAKEIRKTGTILYA